MCSRDFLLYGNNHWEPECLPPTEEIIFVILQEWTGILWLEIIPRTSAPFLSLFLNIRYKNERLFLFQFSLGQSHFLILNYTWNKIQIILNHKKILSHKKSSQNALIFFSSIENLSVTSKGCKKSKRFRSNFPRVHLIHFWLWALITRSIYSD